MKKIFFYVFILIFMGCFSTEKLPENNIKTDKPQDTIKFKNLNDIDKKNDSSKRIIEDYYDNSVLMSPNSEASDVYESSNLIKIKNNTSSNKKIILPKVNNLPLVEVKEGKLIYSIPDTMKLGTIYTINIRIKKNINNVKIIDSLYKQKVIDIKVNNLMEVVVIDPSPTESKNFNILKQNSDKQLIEDDNYTEWIYSVQPLKSGNLKLNIIVSIIKDDNLKQVVYFNSTYVQSNTAVVVKTFWEKYWQWLLSTIIIPFIVFIYKSRKNNEE